MATWLSTCTHKQFPIMHIHAKNSYCQEEKKCKKKNKKSMLVEEQYELVTLA